MLYILGATTGIHWFSYSNGNWEEKIGKLQHLKLMCALKYFSLPFLCFNWLICEMDT